MQHFAYKSFFSSSRRIFSFLALVCVLVCFGAAGVRAQDAAQPTRQAKRLTPLRSADTPEGSRVTVTADAPLNDYAAYRSGNRFYVVVPNAATSSGGAGGLSGRGFEDARVERRGNDLSYSFRLQPGARARVNQRFNRLDVVFDAPGGTTANANTAPPTQPATTPRETGTNTAASTSVVPGASDAANQNRAQQNSAAARRQQERASLGIPPASNTAASDLANASNGLNNAATPTFEPSPLASDVPPTNEIAQAQPPPVAAPAPPAAIVTTTAPEQTLTFGAVVARYWGWGIVVLALLFGLGLFFATRGKERGAAPPPPTLAAPLDGRNLDDDGVGAPVKSGVKRDAATTLESVPSPSTGFDAPNAHTANADASLSPVSLAGNEGATSPASLAPAALAGAAIGALGATDERQEQVARHGQSPRRVALNEEADLDDAEIVQAEVAKLLAGDEHNGNIIASAGDYARSLVSTELLSALAGRNVVRREAAERAYLSYGYFDYAVRDLQDARASAERASAARALGLLRNRQATPHLVKALEDKSPEVRRASVEALAEIRDPAAVSALEKRRDREKRRDMPRQLINRAITACAAGAVIAETSTALPAPTINDEADTPANQSALFEDTTRVAQVTPLERLAAVPADAPVVVLDAEPASVEPVQTLDEAPSGATEAEIVTLESTAPVEETATAPALPEVAADHQATVAEAGDFDIIPVAPIETPIAAEAVEPAADAAFEEATIEPPAGVIIETSGATAEEIAAEDVAPSEETVTLTAGHPALIDGETFDDAATLERQPAQSVIESYEQPVARTSDDLGATEFAPTEFAPTEFVTMESETTVEPTAASFESIAQADAAASRATEDEWFDMDTGAGDSATLEEPEGAPQEVTPQEITAQEVAWEDETIEYSSAPVEVVAEEAVVEAPIETTPDAEYAFGLAPVVQTEDAGANGQAEEGIDLTGIAPVFVTNAATETAEMATGEAATAPLPDGDNLNGIPEGVRTRLMSADAHARARGVGELSRFNSPEALHAIYGAFDDSSEDVRAAAAHALYAIGEDRTNAFTQALREATPERRRHIGQSIAASGLAGEAINNLAGESREKTYEAFSLLFLMAKAGEFGTLLKAIEQNPNTEVRLAVVKLLALSGQPEVLPAFRRLAVRGSLPAEVRSAVMEAIYQIANQPTNA